jgi:flagellar biosynthetic protein FliQ
VDIPALIADSISLALWVSAPALAASLIAGLLSSLLQSAVHTSDAALSFAPRFLAVVAALLLGRELLSTQLVNFTARLLHEMARVGG